MTPISDAQVEAATAVLIQHGEFCTLGGAENRHCAKIAARACLEASEAMRNTEGWKLVPIEPTEEMYAAAEREWDGRMSARSRGVWQAMIEVSPTPITEGE